MAISRDLEEVIEIMKKATVYGEEKSTFSQAKTENNKSDRVEENVAKGTRAIGALVVDKREKSKLFQETPTKRSILVL